MKTSGEDLALNDLIHKLVYTYYPWQR